jgi:predicted amidohydrolase YtcJ
MLRGRCVMPAFTDAHTHFPSWSLGLSELRLEDVHSAAEAVDRVRTAPRSASGWIRGRGWRDATWPDRPTAAALDAVTGDTPCALWHRDTHSLWLNAAALRRADGDLEVPGGVVERDASGAPTGILREEAAWAFRERYLRATEEELVEATRLGIRAANARGVAAIHDKDGDIGAATVFARLKERDGLHVRVWQSIPHTRLDGLLRAGVPSRTGDDLLRLGYVKVFMDGTLGSGTAAMLDGSGVVITTSEELEEIVRRAASAGWPVAVHAIGDRANRDALDALERSRDAWQPRGLRHRIEHCQCVHPADLPRFAELGVACSVQFSHATSDRDLAEQAWGDRIAGAYAWRSLWDSGAMVVNGSDAPVEELDPLVGIRAGVLRTSDDRPAWRAEQALTVEEAILASTVNAAWLAGDERRRGRLIPGFLADLVVLSRDPFDTPPEELGSIEVVATMVGGRWVFNAPPWD